MTGATALCYVSNIGFTPGPNDDLVNGTWSITLTPQPPAVSKLPSGGVVPPVPQPTMATSVTFRTTIKPTVNLGDSLYVTVSA